MSYMGKDGKELAFRDYLIAHPQEARNYEALKKNLVTRFQYDREAYTEGKTPYIESVLKKLKDQTHKAN